MEPFKSDGEGFSTPQLQGVYMHRSKKGPTYPLLAGAILHGTPHTHTTHPHLLMKTPLVFNAYSVTMTPFIDVGHKA